MFVFDTNVLLDAANRASVFHDACWGRRRPRRISGHPLVATPRHAAVLAQTLADLHGSGTRDVQIAVLMREHELSGIRTRDSGFRRFPFLTVVDPVGGEHG